MFAYIDPSIRARLAREGKVFRVDARGNRIDPDGASPDSDLALNVVGPIPLPLDLRKQRAISQWYAFVRHTELNKAQEIADVLCQRGDQRLFPLLSSHMSVNSALMWGELRDADQPLVRVHSSCLTGDVFGSLRCECGPQLMAALNQIYEHPTGGVLIYMSGHEGRGIGLWAKAMTYVLQDTGQDTYQANLSLGLPADSRDFSDSAAMLLYLLGGDRPFSLLTNNPKKVDDLKRAGLTKLTPRKLIVGVNEWNRRYLFAKREWGHDLEPEDLGMK